MHDEHPHPLLAQVPLTVSPFLSLPTSVPLPYTYKSLPSTLPPSILQPSNNQSSDPQHQQQNQPNAYVTSASGTSATPDQILTSCVALQQHLAKLEADAKRTLDAWHEKRRQEDLAEKRRVAPGWLDSGVHIIKPENVDGGVQQQQQGGGEPPRDLMDEDPQRERKEREGEELDRVFGGLKV